MHTEPDPTPWQQLRDAILDDSRLVRAVASGRRRGARVDYRRVELRYIEVKAGLRLQVTSYDDTQAYIRNVTPGADTEAVVDALLAAGYASWHVQRTDDTLQL